MPDNPQVTVPDICRAHQAEACRVTGYRPDDTWRAMLVVLQILLFRAVASEAGIAKRAGHDANGLSLVLAELGCLACARPKLYRTCLRVIRRGFSHAAQVSQGKEADAEYERFLPSRPPEATNG